MEAQESPNAKPSANPYIAWAAQESPGTKPSTHHDLEVDATQEQLSAMTNAYPFIKKGVQGTDGVNAYEHVSLA